MTTKLKNRLQKMNFQKQINRRYEVEETDNTKYYEELYSNKIRELLGTNYENISTVTRGSIRSQHI